MTKYLVIMKINDIVGETARTLEERLQGVLARMFYEVDIENIEILAD
jgi:hypothetical protein